MITFKIPTLFKVLDKIHAIKIFLGFHEPRSLFYMFNINLDTFDLDQIYKRLIDLGYQYNVLSYQDSGQIFNVRKLYGERQIHVRIFKDGEVRGHDELNFEFCPNKHLRGDSLREIEPMEVIKLKEKFGFP